MSKDGVPAAHDHAMLSKPNLPFILYLRAIPSTCTSHDDVNYFWRIIMSEQWHNEQFMARNALKNGLFFHYNLFVEGGTEELLIVRVLMGRNYYRLLFAT